MLTGLAAPAAVAAGESGLYGAVDVGQSKASDSSCTPSASLGVTSLSCSNTDTGYRFSLGYPLNSTFSGEVGYYNIGSISANLTGVYLGTPYTASASVKGTEWQFSALGSVPVADKFSVFGKLGIVRWDIKASVSATAAGVTAAGSQSATGTDFLWGFGGKYDITNNVAVRAQFESHKAGDDAKTGRGTVDFMSAGIVYKF